jgi:hypothetical protein
MISSELDFYEVNYPYHEFVNLDGFIETDERLIDAKSVKKFFKKNLEENLILSTVINDADIEDHKDCILLFGKKYDYMVNCTWGAFGVFDNLDIYYEPCITLLYKTLGKKDFSLTIMDGEFISLYPYEDTLYTLTSVKNTPLCKCSQMDEAVHYIGNITEREIVEIRAKCEEEVMYYYPEFSEEFSYKNYYLSIKTKLNVKNDSRQSIVEFKGRKLFILSGKVDTIFDAEQEVIKHLSS